AKDCPHCVHLAPVWQDAQHQWMANHHGDGADVTWQQKDGRCFGPGWAKGRDYAECQRQGVESFPTIKYFPSAKGPGVEYEDERSADGIQDFLQSQVSAVKADADAAGAAAADAPGVAAAPRVVEFYAKDCPHCQDLEPVWKDRDAKQQWLEANGGEDGGVTWSQKDPSVSGKAGRRARTSRIHQSRLAFPPSSSTTERLKTSSWMTALLPSLWTDFVDSHVNPEANHWTAEEVRKIEEAVARGGSPQVAQAAAPVALAALQAPASLVARRRASGAAGGSRRSAARARHSSKGTLACFL
ncbi:unnamed protein product, partial [Prorocentrum cordatum]